MFDPKEQDKRVRRNIEGMTPEMHAHIYAQFYNAYLATEKEGDAKKTELSLRHMQSLLSYGKISDTDRMVIEAKVCLARAESMRVFAEITALYADEANTTLH